MKAEREKNRQNPGGLFVNREIEEWMGELERKDNGRNVFSHRKDGLSTKREEEELSPCSDRDLG